MTQKFKKVSLGNKLAFACGDIFGGGSFNIINFLFVPFLTLVVGIPMIYVTPILLFTKIWDGLIDPFIGMVTDGKRPGKFGKRRYFMLVAAPLVWIGLVMLFFPWNMVTNSVFWKCVFVVLMYVLYATAQSFVLIPYYSHASEMTGDFSERNKVNAVRLAFSIMSSLVCVVVPGMIASPSISASNNDNGMCYLVMAGIFGGVFTLSILVTALFSKEQIITPAVQNKFSFAEFVRPLKVKTYRQYLGMQMCASMGMAVMSSYFYTYCDFFIRRDTNFLALSTGSGRAFAVATIAAAMMFVAQIIALPIYLHIIKKRGKRFAYIFGATLWIVVALVLFLMPAEPIGSAVVGSNGLVATTQGVPDWAIVVFGLSLGIGIGGTVFVPHSSFGDVCDVGELQFGKRTEGAFSGLTNFLNTTAQAIGLSIPSAIIGTAGYVETKYVSLEQYQAYLDGTSDIVADLGLALGNFKATVYENSVQLVPMLQHDGAQLAIRIAFTLLPIAIMVVGIVVASKYKLTATLQQQIVQTNALDHDSDLYKQQQQDLLGKL